MDILTQTEICLRNARYDTRAFSTPYGSVTCFESNAILGFVHVFETAIELLQEWQMRQKNVLTRHAISLRGAGTKAWNVYSVFLTSERAPSLTRPIERIEEDFTLTRKIARTSVISPDDVERSLLPLTAIGSQPLLGASNFEQRLRARLKDVPVEAVTAFLNEIPATEVARILGAKP